MKLLYVSEATGWCGGANQIWLTAQRLKRLGHEVSVACREGFTLFDRLKAAGVGVIPFVPRQDYDIPGARRLASIAREVGAQVVHAHHPRAHALALLATFVGLSAPVVVTRRVITPIGRNPFSRFKYSSRRIKRFIAVCEPAADELVRAGAERSRIDVIPSGVDFARWEPARAGRSRAGDGPPVVTMVAHYAAIKGHEVLLQAIPLVRRVMPEVRFRIAGRDTESLRPKANALGLNGEVELLGERHDIPELLASSRLYVMPSLQEGIGTALIEAQAALVPTVASRVGGLPYVADEGRAGRLVTPGDPRELAEGIVAALRDKAESERLARFGYQRAERLFSVDAVVERLEKVYQSLA
ncbi:MAG: glycosyltransferase family 4 protein [Elusimicrobia bacterium]|nr:glycosyltransferase family 4 protein [Elusimicrobiota bacterium]